MEEIFQDIFILLIKGEHYCEELIQLLFFPSFSFFFFLSKNYFGTICPYFCSLCHVKTWMPEKKGSKPSSFSLSFPPYSCVREENASHGRMKCHPNENRLSGQPCNTLGPYYWADWLRGEDGWADSFPPRYKASLHS